VTSEEADIKASSVFDDLPGLAVAPLSNSALEDWSVLLASVLLTSKEIVRKVALSLAVGSSE
jgi:hypothetical protein